MQPKGPLLQRASFTQSMMYNGAVVLNVSVVPEIPAYFTGLYSAGAAYGDFSRAMLPIVDAFTLNEPITNGVQGCDDSVCRAKVRAPALVPRYCESSISEKNLSAPDASENTVVFAMWLTPNYGDTEILDLETRVGGDDFADACAGPLNKTNCYLQSAIAEYDIVITNGTLTLDNAAHPRFVAWANNTAITNHTINIFNLDAGDSWIQTTLGGIIYAFQLGFENTVTLALPDSKPRWPPIVNWFSAWFLYRHITNYPQADKGSACTYAWRDPRSEIMSNLNELMFRTGVYLGSHRDVLTGSYPLDPGLVTDYAVNGTLRTPLLVFATDFPYFYGAAALQTLTVLVVLFTFYGFWRLDRRVSFCPLETAKVSNTVTSQLKH